MKKLTMALALALCLVLCVFAFASCGKKKSNETSPATDAATTPATTPATDAATTPKTNAATDAATDAATTPAATDEATNAATDAAPATAPATDAATDPATDPAETDAATGCVHEWDEGEENYVIDAEPDCFTEGSKSIHCNKCGKPVPETVVVLPIQHTPEDDYEIDTEPTCCAEGLKILYCAECGDVIEEVPIDIDPEAHKINEWNVIEPVNMFHKNGSKTGVCIYCDETFTEGITFAPTVETFTSASKQFATPKVYFDDVRGDDHFYPTEENLAGNDLFVEFSILWNETLLNFDSSADPYIDGVFDQGKPFYYFSPVAGCNTSDANFPGAFEWMGNFKTPIDDDEVDTPETMCKESPNYEDYPNIGGADEANPEWGWHRIGVRYHLELLDGKSGADLKDYQGTATVYLDGVAIYKLATGAPEKEGMQTWGSHLFKATRDAEDENLIEYVEENNYLIVIKINQAKAKADTTVYFAYADVIVSCGKDFVMPVQRVDDPEAATLEVAEGVEIAAPIFFRPVEE